MEIARELHPNIARPPRPRIDPPQATSRPSTTTLEGIKDALTDTLVTKMRTKFADESDDVAAIIADEVAGFMSLTGSVKDSDIASLEGRIRDRVLGAKSAARRYKGPVNDEWAEISAFVAEEGVRLEAEKKTKIAAQKKAYQAQLDAQVAAKAAKKEEAKRAVLLEKAELEAQQEKWRQEELAKLSKKAAATERLLDDRKAQVDDLHARKAAQTAAKKQEEADLRRALAADFRKKVAQETEAKRVKAIETEALKKSNAETLLLREEQEKADAALDLEYQRLYAEKLQKQEEAYLENIAKMKEKLDAQSVGEPIPSYKRYMPDEVIERNARNYDRLGEEREARDVAKAEALAQETRRHLAEQVKWKQDKLDRERAAEAARHERFAYVVNTLEDVEKSEAAATRSMRVAHRMELEAQMRDNLVRKAVFPMTDTEKSLNADMLARVNEYKTLRASVGQH